MKPLRGTAAVAMLATAVLAAPAAQIRVQPVVNEGRILASFTAVDEWTVEMRETLQVGSAVTFDYQVEIRRPSTLWDRVMAETNVRAEAKLDLLTGKYQVSRQRDGRMIKSENRDQENDVRDWLTVFENVELIPESPLKANTDYYIHVRLTKHPKRNVSLWAVLPGGSGDSSGRAPFTYLRF